jgi:hypothetical protein
VPCNTGIDCLFQGDFVFLGQKNAIDYDQEDAVVVVHSPNVVAFICRKNQM